MSARAAVGTNPAVKNTDTDRHRPQRAADLDLLRVGGRRLRYLGKDETRSRASRSHSPIRTARPSRGRSMSPSPAPAMIMMGLGVHFSLATGSGTPSSNSGNLKDDDIVGSLSPKATNDPTISPAFRLPLLLEAVPKPVASEKCTPSGPSMSSPVPVIVTSICLVMVPPVVVQRNGEGLDLGLVLRQIFNRRRRDAVIPGHHPTKAGAGRVGVLRSPSACRAPRPKRTIADHADARRSGRHR